jgi:hypothetical protein
MNQNETTNKDKSKNTTNTNKRTNEKNTDKQKSDKKKSDKHYKNINTTKTNKQNNINKQKQKLTYFKDLDIKTKDVLSLGKMFKYNMEISYIKPYLNGERIVFKTPMLYIPNKPRNIYDNDGKFMTSDYYNLDLLFFNDEDDVKEFEEWIIELEKRVWKLLKKRSYLKLKKENLRTSIYEDSYRDCCKLKLRLDSKVSKFYLLENQNTLGKRVKYSELVAPTYGIFIIELENIWVRRPTVLNEDDNVKNTFGFNFVIHASQCLPSHCVINPIDELAVEAFGNSSAKLLNKMNLLQSQNASSAPPPPPPPPPPGFGVPPPPLPPPSQPTIPDFLQPFMRMLKMGVPRVGVKQKMQLQGLDPSLLDNPTMGKTSSTSTGSGGSIPRITADMLQGITLKKGKAIEKVKKKPTGGMGFNVSLDDILNMKSRLKKREPPKVYEKPRYQSDSEDDTESDYTSSEDDNDNNDSKESDSDSDDDEWETTA